MSRAALPNTTLAAGVCALIFATSPNVGFAAQTPFAAALEAQSKGQVDKARTLYSQILANDPSAGRALINLGLLEIRQRRISVGRAHCQKALELDAAASKVHYCLGLADVSTDPSAASLAFQRAIDLLPDDPAAKVELAHLHRKAQRYDEAVQLYREAVRHRADDPDLHVHLGYCYRKLKQYPAARVEYAKAVQKDPNSYYGHLDLGWVLVKLKEYSAAEPHYLAAARLNDKSPDPHYNLGNLYRREGAPIKAADAYAAAVRRAPGDVQARLSLVRAAWRAHRPLVAKDNLQALRRLKLTKAQSKALDKLGALIERTPPALPKTKTSTTSKR